MPQEGDGHRACVVEDLFGADAESRFENATAAETGLQGVADRPRLFVDLLFHVVGTRTRASRTRCEGGPGLHLRLAVLRCRLDALGFGRRLRIQRFPERVGLFGDIGSAEELARVNALVASFNDEFGSRPRLEVTGTDTLLGESTIALEIRAVVGGDDVHVILHDGTRVSPGSEVDGYEVDALTERYMILKRTPRGPAAPARGEDVAYFVFADA